MKQPFEISGICSKNMHQIKNISIQEKLTNLNKYNKSLWHLNRMQPSPYIALPVQYDGNSSMIGQEHKALSPHRSQAGTMVSTPEEQAIIISQSQQLGVAESVFQRRADWEDWGISSTQLTLSGQSLSPALADWQGPITITPDHSLGGGRFYAGKSKPRRPEVVRQPSSLLMKQKYHPETTRPHFMPPALDQW